MSVTKDQIKAEPLDSRSLREDEKQEDEDPKRPRRNRTLTEKGEEQYLLGVQEHSKRVERSWDHVRQVMLNVSQCENTRSAFVQSKKDLNHAVLIHKENDVNFEAFLRKINTEESRMELENFRVTQAARVSIVQTTRSQLDEQIAEYSERGSVRSKTKTSSGSNSTISSNLSVLLAKKRAKAESAKAGVHFVEQEAKLRCQRASLEADLNVLAQKRQAAEAEAEVQELLRATEDGLAAHSLDDLPEDDPRERTDMYVDEHYPRPPKDTPKITQPTAGIDTRSAPLLSVSQTSSERFKTDAGQNPHAYLIRGQNPHAQEFTPATVTMQSPQFPPATATMQSPQFPPATAMMQSPQFQTNLNYDPTLEFSRFLLKKELLLSRLTKYDDRPGSYAIWKSGFCNVMQELQVSPTEELDLLLKWLGTESARHAISLRAANPQDPERALARIWERLGERFGAPELVEAALKSKLEKFPKLNPKDRKRLYELSDIVDEVVAAKENEDYKALLSYFDTASGVIPIVNKLPYFCQEKWTTRAWSYKMEHGVSFPPFSVFARFLRDLSRSRNDPSFLYEEPAAAKQDNKQRNSKTRTFTNYKTDVATENNPKSPSTRPDIQATCPIHQAEHSLNECRRFRSKPLDERKNFLKNNRVCFKCCASTSHMAHQCTDKVQCSHCKKDNHPTALHLKNTKPAASATQGSKPAINDGGEKSSAESKPNVAVSASCTQVCDSPFTGKSCAKIVLARVYPEGQPQKSIRAYVILDDQSNTSLAKSKLFELMNLSVDEISYTLTSCGGSTEMTGRKSPSFILEALEFDRCLKIPALIECDNIPNSREEIPTKDVALSHPHLHDIADHIPQLEDSEILLLIGRDVPEAHHVLNQRIGPTRSPYAQELCLGWVIVGESCLDRVHKPQDVNVKRTHVLHTGRPSHFEPCPNTLQVKEVWPTQSRDDFGSKVFDRTDGDDKDGLSTQDKDFLYLMQGNMHRDSDGNWVAPLPFKTERRSLPNNRPMALRRAKLFDINLKRNPKKLQHCIEFMEKIISKGHAEPAPALIDGEECWYLPVFGVYHPNKPDRIRGVFDSSAQYEGVSLNDILLKGPDLVNRLLGVLLRFRKEPVGIVGDIETMFYSFKVQEAHRNFLRFFWYESNNPDLSLIEYRMTVHVFGNSPSPAIATYGLRLSVQDVSSKDVQNFVEKNFYVDDGLISLPSDEEAISLMKRTQAALKEGGNLRLHKIASNSPQVMNVFQLEDKSQQLKELCQADPDKLLQSSLGLMWNLAADSITFKVPATEKEYTRRGVLSTLNSLYDPLGIAAPVTIKGKILMRDLMTQTSGWDDPLPTDRKREWEDFRESLKLLEQVQIPRTYGTSATQATARELHIFADASEQAIAAVAYLKQTDTAGAHHVGFVLGKTKIAPKHGHTIPRLELCAAVMAVEISDYIQEELDLAINQVCYYSDSRIVLGYIHNSTRKFKIYVCNRVERIRRSSSPAQWRYIASEMNPADQGTRSIPSSTLPESMWVQGPKLLLRDPPSTSEEHELQEPDSDVEIKPQVTTMTSKVQVANLGTQRFERFSSWKRLTRTIATLQHVVRSFREGSSCKGWHLCQSAKTPNNQKDAEYSILREVQAQAFPEEYKNLCNKSPLPRKSMILDLNPWLDGFGIMRVGGRLSRSQLPEHQKTPIIIPKAHHTAVLLIRHFHDLVQHQGRHFTEGAVRAAGYWIIGGKRLIYSVLHQCVKCRKLRGTQMTQIMSDLPQSRLQPSPPFFYVGVDAFGPWNVVSRRTRGGEANSKRWAILFTCLYTRAIHIEVVEDMSTSAFINALRRFVAIRGKVLEFRSDRGTNFIGSTGPLGLEAVNVETGPVADHLSDKGSRWIFNPPHSSHMGGVWERMIGITRRILDAMMLDSSLKKLTHEVLVTFMSEVCAIVNARPLVPVSSDPEHPFILTPSMLLTQKSDDVDETLVQIDSPKDMYRAQWMHVQALANRFWQRWRSEYLNTLQHRTKWKNIHPNLKKDDIVLLKNKQEHRNDWPVGIVVDPLPGDDGKVRKAVIKVFNSGKPTHYTRPISELVLLLSGGTNES